MGALVTVMVSPKLADGCDVAKDAAAALIAGGWTAPKQNPKPKGPASVSELKPLTKWQEAAINKLWGDTKPIRDWLVSAGLIAPPIPTDPRERALYLRKHRNTGPGKPIQEQRRTR